MPADVAPFGSVVRATAGFVGELLAWLSPGEFEGDPYRQERVACIFALTQTVGGESVPIAPNALFLYVPESELTVIGPQLERPAMAAYFGALIVSQHASALPVVAESNHNSRKVTVH